MSYIVGMAHTVCAAGMLCACVHALTQGDTDNDIYYNLQTTESRKLKYNSQTAASRKYHHYVNMQG